MVDLTYNLDVKSFEFLFWTYSYVTKNVFGYEEVYFRYSSLRIFYLRKSNDSDFPILAFSEVACLFATIQKFSMPHSEKLPVHGGLIRDSDKALVGLTNRQLPLKFMVFVQVIF